MIKLNGVEFAFDADIISDANLFDAAFKSFSAAETHGVDAMGTFLRDCLASGENKEKLESVLSDGRMSTLCRIFAEFFKQVTEQKAETERKVAEAHDILRDVT